MARHVPNKTGEFAGDGNAEFLWRQLSSHRKSPPAHGQAQLRIPRDVTDDLGMTFLANLEVAADLWLEAIVPGGLRRDTSGGVLVAAFGDATLAAARATVLLSL